MWVQAISYFAICFLGLVSGQSVNNCATKETCEECIQEIDCAWCILPEFESNDTAHAPVNCHPSIDSSKWCNGSSLVSPQMKFEVINDAEFSNDVENPTQVKPQRVKLSLRKGQKYDLKFRFKQAANYPVDLYYLMDLSKSMEDYKDKLALLGTQLAETMINITTNFRLGFGSFIDKRDLPFVSTVPARLASPCSTSKTKVICVSPYSYKNQLSLTNNYNTFVDEVNAAKVSGNLDSPEGGLDALMQAIVCKKKIGWRDQARHLLVFSTDAEFHIAGDGKLAGVIEPNPATCYSNDSEYLIYDYPSVSQINYVARENNINIIFAIVKKTSNTISRSYRLLSDNIKNSNFGELDGKGDNVINLVVDNYNKIVQTVKFIHNASNEVDIKFSSNCNSSIPDRCNNVHVGQELDFVASIELRECPQDGTKTKLISIRPEALKENITIELEFQCDCPCSSKSDPTYLIKSKKCNGVGDLRCGVCDCYKGSFGKNCQCDSSQSSSENVTNCIMEGSTDICSGSGTCKCGKCECNTNPNDPQQRIDGPFCECDNFSCKREGGLLCSGNGNCKCKKCECFADFSGDACECHESQTNCIAPGSNLICSDHGTCLCGHCECAIKDNNRYSGKYCEDCTSCPAQRCEELRHCVECQVYHTGIYEKTCKQECTAFKTIETPSLDSDDIDEIKKCRIPDNENCIINFDYFYGRDNKLVVRALDRKICPEPPNVLAWTLGVIATILIAGLILLLIWKVFTTIHDRREYAKFENERKNLKWGANDNPLYKDATSRFANPAYKRGSVRFSMNRE